MRWIVVESALLFLFLAPSVGAQKTCFVANESPAPAGRFVSAMTSPFCFKEKAGAGTTLVTAVDFYLKASTAVSTSIELYDEDPVTGKPKNLLATGTAAFVPDVEGWYGAVFPQPVSILPNTSFFVGVHLGPGVAPMVVTNGAGVRSTPHWWDKAAGWSGPNVSFGWRYRLYCGQHNGVFTNYGTGKMGTGGAIPILLAQGWPNTGNLMSLNLRGALNAAPAILLVGVRGNLAFPDGALYVSPILISTAGLTVGAAPGGGFLLTDLRLPIDPSLAQVRVAFQSLIIDAGAINSLAHTNGVEAVLGH